jgi:hypothetical protein
MTGKMIYYIGLTYITLLSLYLLPLHTIFEFRARVNLDQGKHNHIIWPMHMRLCEISLTYILLII